MEYSKKTLEMKHALFRYFQEVGLSDRNFGKGDRLEADENGEPGEAQVRFERVLEDQPRIVATLCLTPKKLQALHTEYVRHLPLVSCIRVTAPNRNLAILGQLKRVR